MLDINPETVCFIITRSREFQTSEQAAAPVEFASPTSDTAFENSTGEPEDLTSQELKVAIADLEPDQQVSLVALMWVGRGDYDDSDWENALTEARDSWNNRTAEYLIATPLLADYLTEGLAQLGYSCEE